MKTSALYRYALCASVTAALLAGCGLQQAQNGTPLPIGAPGASAAQRVAPAPDAGRPLLYVVHETSRSGHSEIAIIALTQNKLLTSITGYGYISSVCSDASGDVWAPNLRHRRWYVDKFARGGTREIDELRAPRFSSLVACTVDPSSGDLAVVGANVDGGSDALIWSGARSGKPAMYPLPFCTVAAAYDNADNLFITGWGCGSDFNVYLGELAKGSGPVALIDLDKRMGPLGGVQWDGSYVVIATVRAHALLYRVQVTGTTGKVVGTVKPQGFDMCCFFTPNGLFVLHDRAAIGMAGKNGERVWDWPYPAGGKPLRSIARLKGINGIALSI
jgi:hypothetical protein